MTAPDPMLAWLREQLAEDERAARAAERDSQHPEWETSDLSDSIYTADRGSPVVSGPFDYLADGLKAHLTRWDPARVLAEVESKREILKLHAKAHECSTYEDHCSWILDSEVCDTVRLMLTPYRGRPGYDPDWSSRWTA